MRGGPRGPYAAVLAAAVLSATLGGVLAAGAQAVVPAAGPPYEPTLTADPLPTWQTDGDVWALAHGAGVVYAGGNFSAVRPPGAAPGTSEEPAADFAAFDADTGVRIGSCDPRFTLSTGAASAVQTLELSPDGDTLYVGGKFNRVNGTVTVGNFAAIDTATCSPIMSLRPRFSGIVWSLMPTADSVYAGGAFTGVGGVPRQRLAAIGTAPDTLGDLLDWAPAVDRTVNAVDVAPDGSQVFVGGEFFTVNGQAAHALVALDPASGAVIRTYPTWVDFANAEVKGIAHDAQNLYVAAEGFGADTFEGRIAGALDSSTYDWKDLCRGATQEVEPYQGVLYSASHAHNCTRSLGGFQEGAMQGRQHLLANAIDDGEILPWFPDTNDAPDAAGLGPWALVAAGGDMWVGGEFSTVNAAPQQSLTRFRAEPQTTDVGAPELRPRPTATSTQAGRVRVRWPASWDRDDAMLTYTLFRDRTLVDTQVVDSRFWRRPTLSFEDTGRVPGTTHSYRINVTDGTTATGLSTTATVTVAAADAPYRDQVLADGASLYWRLGEAGGATAASETGGNAGGYQGGVTYRVPGSPAGQPDTAVTMNGSTGYVGGRTSWNDPQQYSTELWFRTAEPLETAAGKLIGFGSAATGRSVETDRHVYVNESGQLQFGTWNYGDDVTIKTTQAYNDGLWHHLVATGGPAGMHLYVDGVEQESDPTATTGRQYTGFWRVGNDVGGVWEEIGLDAETAFGGSLDEVAVYPYQLSPAAVAAHFQAGT